MAAHGTGLAKVPGKERQGQGSSHELAGCVCFNLRKASRAVTQLYDSVLSDHKLRITQFSILAVLLAYGRPRRMSDLAQDLVMDRTTLTRNLRPLERSGYLRVMCGSDRRERLAEITPEGRDLIEALLPLWREAQAQAQSLLGQDRWPSIRSDLNDFVRRVSAAGDEESTSR